MDKTDQPSQTPLVERAVQRLRDNIARREATEDVEALKTVLEALSAARRDAERYRFIMSGKRFGVIDREGSAMLTYQGTAFDAMIDAAIAKGGK